MKVQITRPGVPDTEINVEIMAKKPDQLGSRPVVFILPGGPGADYTHYLGYTIIQEVADIVFHDPRGCGQSGRGDPASYNMVNYIDDVEAIRKHLQLEQIVVVGKSYGSMCALGYTIKYPQAVSKLVLAAGAPSYRFMDHAKRNLKRIGTQEQFEYCETMWNGTISSREQMLKFFELTSSLYSVKARRNPPPLEALEVKANSFSYDVLNQGFKNNFWYFDYEPQLASIQCPTLILFGREDWVNDVSLGELMASRIQRSELVIYDNASHAMEADVSEAYFRKIIEFIVA